MPKFVIKKDGEQEPFDIEKLKQSIRINAIDATLKETEGKINNLIEQISNTVIRVIEKKDAIPTEEIKEKILKELDSVAPNVAKTWREYDQEIKC